MKVYEVLDQEVDDNVLKTDIKHNKGKAVTALVKGAKRKSNPADQPVSGVDPEEEITRMG